MIQNSHIHPFQRNGIHTQGRGGKQGKAQINMNLSRQPLGFVLHLIAVDTQESTARIIAHLLIFGRSKTSVFIFLF